MCSETVTSGSVSDPVQWFPRQNHTCTYYKTARGTEDRRHPILIFDLVPYTQRFLQILLFLMTLCTVNDKVFKVFTILHWEILFWKCSIICKYVFLQTGEPLRSFASLSCAFYTHICVTACCQLAPSVSPAVLFQYCSDSQHLLTLS